MGKIGNEVCWNAIREIWIKYSSFTIKIPIKTIHIWQYWALPEVDLLNKVKKDKNGWKNLRCRARLWGVQNNINWWRRQWKDNWWACRIVQGINLNRKTKCGRKQTRLDKRIIGRFVMKQNEDTLMKNWCEYYSFTNNIKIKIKLSPSNPH